MITEKEIIEILNDWEFGANLKNGGFVRGVKNEYYKNVARAIVSKNESLHTVILCDAPKEVLPCRHKCMSQCQLRGQCNYQKHEV